jgi:hypothetical protein
MRLISRLFVLVLLVGIAAFTNLVSPISYASPCEDGCYRGYDFCMGNGKPPNQGACATALQNCLNKCGNELD